MKQPVAYLVSFWVEHEWHFATFCNVELTIQLGPHIADFLPLNTTIVMNFDQVQTRVFHDPKLVLWADLDLVIRISNIKNTLFICPISLCLFNDIVQRITTKQ